MQSPSHGCAKHCAMVWPSHIRNKFGEFVAIRSAKDVASHFAWHIVSFSFLYFGWCKTFCEAISQAFGINIANDFAVY